MNDLFLPPVDTMRAISLWQPWASAIPLGLKSIETRHWKTKHRGEIAIHAARKWDGENKPFASIEYTLGRLPKRLPFGAIVAVATLVDIRSSEELKLTVSAIERMYGDYAPGRFGWLLEDIKPLREPIGCIGRQSIWMLSPEIVAEIRAQL